MSRKSTSTVVTQPKTVETRTFEPPMINEQEALLSVELAGVCGSDSKAYQGDYKPELLPAILGHEILGRIEEIETEAERNLGIRENQRVIVEGRRRCGICDYCLDGRYQFCEQEGLMALPRSKNIHRFGEHTENISSLLPGTVAHPISEEVPAEAAVLGCAIIGNSVRWLQESVNKPFDKSLIIRGCGPQALSMTIVADKLGFSPIIVTGIPGDERRLKLARELGADETVCRPPAELADGTREIAGELADIVVNLTGTPDSAQDSIDLVGIGGIVVYPNVVGDVSSEVRLDDLVHKDATIRGVISRTAPDVRRAINFIERNPEPFTRLISHTFPITEAERAYRIAGGETDKSSLKVTIDPIT